MVPFGKKPSNLRTHDPGASTHFSSCTKHLIQQLKGSSLGQYCTRRAVIPQHGPRRFNVASKAKIGKCLLDCWMDKVPWVRLCIKNLVGGPVLYGMPSHGFKNDWTFSWKLQMLVFLGLLRGADLLGYHADQIINPQCFNVFGHFHARCSHVNRVSSDISKCHNSPRWMEWSILSPEAWSSFPMSVAPARFLHEWQDTIPKTWS